MSEWRELLSVLPLAGGDAAVLEDAGIAHMVASGHRVLSRREIPGVTIEAEERADAIVGRMTIARGVRLQTPVHLCIGLVHPTGAQRIQMTVTLEEGAAASVLAHCLFMNATDARHTMDAVLDIASGATLRYTEGHYHGPFGGMTVMPKAVVKVGPQGRYFSDFTLTKGRAGKLAIDYVVEVGEQAVAELTAKVFGRGRDDISIVEKLVLAGPHSKGLIKTRVALEDEAVAEITGITEATAEGARGHVDCKEIVRDRARASAVPIVRVSHPLAKVTHEAAIGSVDQKELETLMAHGLTPEQAVEMIVGGILQ
jgi:Fe-S cluster assembly scaffold protein SufB